MKKIITISLAMSILITIFCVGLNINADTVKKYKVTLTDINPDTPIDTRLSGILWTKTANVNGTSLGIGDSVVFDSLNITANCSVNGTYQGVVIYKDSESLGLTSVGNGKDVIVGATKQTIPSTYPDIQEKFEKSPGSVQFAFEFNVEEITVEESISPSETATSTETSTATETASETPSSTAIETATSTETSTATETPSNTATETPSSTATNTPSNTATSTVSTTPKVCTTGKYVLNVSGNTNCNIQIMQGEFKGKISQKMITSCVNGLNDTKIYYNGKWSKGFTLNQGTNEIDVGGKKVNVYVRRNNSGSLEVDGKATKLNTSGTTSKSYYTYSNGRVLPKTGESSSSKLPFVAGGIAFIGLGIGLFITLKKRMI